MINMEWGEIIIKYSFLITLVISLISGAIGYFVKNQVDKRKELLSEVNKERRQAYQDFINIVINLFADLKTKKPKENSSYVVELYEFYKKNILFASPEVVNEFSNYMQFIFHYDKEDKTQLFEHIRRLTSVLQAMRADIGLSNKNLGKDGENLMRAIIRDFDELRKQK